MAQKEVPHLGLTLKEQVSKEAGGWRLGLEVDGGVKREGGVPSTGWGEHLQLMCFVLFFSFCSFSKNVTIKIQKNKIPFFGDFSSWLPIPHLNKKALWARAGGEG